ncbi:MAG TPA: amino acid permease [Bryobacteraceae bacterium]|nr:amino acid permease [Bryobacteraceae bacterium]
MPTSLLVKKPLSVLVGEAGDSEHSLKRTLGPGALVALGIGAIIGAGLFSLTGIAAANNAGPAVVYSFILAAFGCAFAGMCYSEFSTMIPIAGSAYTYAYATMGELLAWIIGWDLVLEYAVGAATVSISWSSYVVSLLHDFGIELPASLIASPWQSVRLADGTNVFGAINLPAVLIVSAISILLMVGIQESARVNEVMVILKVSVVVVFILVGWRFMNPANHTPMIPPNTGTFGEFGYSGIVRAAGVIFFAYIGFDAVSTAAQEARNPQKHMPIGIIGSLIVCTILYVAFAWVMTGLQPYTAFKGSAAPVAVAIAATPYAWLASLVKFAIICGYTSVILVMLLGQSRVFFSMSRDGLLPKMFSDVHPRFRTPWRSNLLFMVFVSLFSGFAPIAVVGEMTSIGTLLAFVIVCAGILVMRKTQPDIRRPFRTPLVPLVPILGILANFGLMLGLGIDNWLRLVIWMAIGLAIYFNYSRKRSKVRVLNL